MIRRFFCLFFVFAVCVFYTPHSVVRKGYEGSVYAKSNIIFLSKARSNSKGFLSSQSDKKKSSILAFSEIRVVFNSSNDSSTDFLFPSNKEYFHSNTLNNYIGKVRRNSCTKQSLSELCVLRI